MNTHEGLAHGIDGEKLFYRSWRPEKPKGVVVVAHGFGEHSGRYAHLAQHLVSHGFAVYAHDLVGHGRTYGQRGHIKEWSFYRINLAIFCNFAHGRERLIPLFLYGHSLGSLIVLSLLTTQPTYLNGAIVSGVLLQPGSTTNPLLLAAMRLLSQYLPTLSFNLRLDVHALSRDPAVIEAYRKDPLVHGRASVRWVTEVSNTLALVKAKAKEIINPLLILHGEADTICRVEGARWLFQVVTHPDKELRIYPGGYHEPPHNDLQKELVLNEVVDWLERHL